MSTTQMSKLTPVLLLVLVFATAVKAQERLFEQEPFDRVTLDEHNDNVVLKVKPLQLPNRRVPQPLPKSGKLLIRLVDQPERAYQVEWHAIDKVELFEQLVLNKANELVADDKLDEAYGYFQFLEEDYPQTPGLDAAMQAYLYKEAIASHRNRRYAGALAMLRELYRLNPKWPRIDNALGMTTDKLAEEYITKQDYRSARALLRNLADWFPEHPVVAARQGRLKQEAAGLLGKAQKAAASGELAEAARLSRQVTKIWPALPGAEQLARSLNEKYPRVVVGVSAPVTDLVPGRLHDWAARRSGRLVYRTLTEFAGPGTDGGTYDCPVGKKESDEPRRLTLRIAPQVRWSTGEASLTGYDVSRRLLAMADRRDAAYQPEWAELLESVAVDGVYGVEVSLRRPHVVPEALLKTILLPYTTFTAARRPPPSNGPYLLPTRTDGEATYLANPHYFASALKQPKEIAERHYARGLDAIRALKRGEVHVVDRVAPWTLEKLRAEKVLVVERYAAPLLHCLIPNLRRPLPAHRAFRRALVYGIHRQAILNQLLGGGPLPGCRVVSGPFLPGLSYDDPIGYAYAPGIPARSYEPRLAIALAELALQEVAAAEKRKGRQLREMPRLVLAHPGDEISRVACTSIKEQLGLIGIPIDLRTLSPGAWPQIPDGVDLLYAELAIWEPVADARRLLAEDGMASGRSPYMGLALRQLDRAGDWQQVQRGLHRIHRIAHDDVAVVPLWQLIDHFAYHKSLEGVGTGPVALYRNVEQWQVGFRYPAE